MAEPAPEPVARLEGVAKTYPGGSAPALTGVSAAFPAGRVTGLAGPDGAGKTTLLRLLAGLLLPDAGRVVVCGVDPAREGTAALREAVSYMPQGFGLYEDLTVAENLALRADLRGVSGAARRAATERLLRAAGLAAFTGRRAGALSGGMKQKLAVACALIRPPRFLLLDEPSYGVDPLSRRELWSLVAGIAAETGMAVVWSTAYLDEAERCPFVVLLAEGRVVHAGPPEALTAPLAGRVLGLRPGPGADRRAIVARALAAPGTLDAGVEGATVRLVLDEGAAPPDPVALGAGEGAGLAPLRPRLEDAYVARLGGAPAAAAPPRRQAPPHGAGTPAAAPAIEARGLTRRFGSFVAAEDVTFAVAPGEVFGLLGPNGAGKSTTFRMLCGLLRPSAGTALVAGTDITRAPAEARARIGYMAQRFSLYGDLTVQQNLRFFAGAYGLGRSAARAAASAAAEEFGLVPYLHAAAGGLPLGFRQRLALACAVMHGPAALFLDEPTSGVDPRARREFWGRIGAMASAGVAVVVTTHFLEEAERCDRVALVERGRVIALGSPEALKARARSPARPEPTLEDAFVAILEAVRGGAAAEAAA